MAGLRARARWWRQPLGPRASPSAGRTAIARSRKSWTDSHAATSAGSKPATGTGSGDTTSCSPGLPNGSRLVVRTRSSGQALSSTATRSAAGIEDVLAVPDGTTLLGFTASGGCIPESRVFGLLRIANQEKPRCTRLATWGIFGQKDETDVDALTEKNVKALAGRSIAHVNVRSPDVVELAVLESEGWRLVVSATTDKEGRPALGARWEPGLRHRRDPSVLRRIIHRPRRVTRHRSGHPLVAALDESHAEVFGAPPERDIVRWFSDASVLSR